MPTQKLLTIKEAATFFKVAEKTLRRWEARGILLPIRTSGGHRRYQLESLIAFKKNKKKILSGKRPAVSSFLFETPKTPELANVEYPVISTPVVIPEVTEEIKKAAVEDRIIERKVRKDHNIKRIAFTAGSFLTLVVFSTFAYTNFSNISGLARNWSALVRGQKVEKNSKNVAFESLKKELETNSNGLKVLAATSFQNISFEVNVDSSFAKDARFLENADVAGTLNLSGNKLTSTDDLVINPLGGAASIGTGTPQKIDSADGDLYVSSQLEVAGDLFGANADLAGNITVSGNAEIGGDMSANTVTVNADTVSDFTGSGLALTNGSLTASLGTAVDSSEITDDTIKEVDLNVSNSPTNAYVLTYNSSTGGFAWAADQTGAASLWTDGGSTTYLTSTTDDLALGGTDNTAPFFFDVSSGNLTTTGDVNAGGNLNGSSSTLSGTLAVNGAGGITSTQSSLLIDAGGEVHVQDTLKAQSLTLDVGGISIPSGQDIDIGGIGFNDTGVTNITSGASLIGVFDEFANSNSTTIQAVLNDLDSAIGSGASKWTQQTGFIYLTNTTDSITVGGTTELGKLAVDGNADEIQLLVQGNATQTSPLATFETSAGTDVVNIDNSGNITVAAGATIDTLTAGLLNIGTSTANAISLGTASNTTTVNGNLTVATNRIFTLNGDAFTDLTGNGLEISANTLAVNLDTTGSDGSSTSSFSGMEITGGELSLLRGCSNDQLLKWNNTTFTWYCAADAGAGSGSSKWTEQNGLLYPNNASSVYTSLGTNNESEMHGLFTVSGTRTGRALVVLNDTGSNQNILTASASGTTVANLDRSGNLAIEGAISDLSGGVLAVNDDLKITGNDIIDSADITRITLGATTTITSTITSLTGDLSVTGGDITLSAGGTIVTSGSGTLTIGDANLTSLIVTAAGTGNATVQLPADAISSTEILDDTIKEIDLNVTNSPTDNYLLTYDQATGGFTWVDPATAGINYWTEQNGVLSPYNGTDVVAATSSGTTVATFTASGTNNALRAGSSTNYLTVDQNGGLTFNGATNDITTASGQDLILFGGGTGVVDIQDATTVDSLTTDTGGITILAGQAIVPSAAGTLTIGNSNLTSLIVTASGTGNATVQLPNDAISGAEILDNTVTEVDLNVTNSPTDNYLLSYDLGSGGFTWIDPATAGINYWTEQNGVLSPYNGTDVVAATSSGTTVGTFTANGTNNALRAGSTTAFMTVDQNGGLTFNGTSSDITTANGENLALSGGGAGIVDIQDATTVDSLTTDTGGITILAGQAIVPSASGALTIGNGNLTGLTITTDGTGNGELVLPTGSVSGLEIFDGSIAETDLDVTNSPTDNYILTYDLGSGGFTWVDPATAGVNYWTEQNGVLSPYNGTDVIAATSSGTTVATFTANGTNSALRAGSSSNYLTVDQNGGLTFTGSSTDITTANGENLTMLAAGSGIIDLQDSVTVDSLTTDTGGITILAGQAIVPSASGSLTIGNGNLTALTITTDGTGNGELVLPTGSVSGLEIFDGSIDETDLNVTNSPTDNYILTYDLGSGGFTWIDPATAGVNYWTEQNGVLSPYNGTDVIAATSSGTTVATFTANGTNASLRAGGSSNYLTVDQNGGLTFTGTANDITTASGENLTLSGGGAGTVDIQDSTTVDSLTTDTGGITILAGQSIIPSASGALTIGNGNLTALTITTDGTGNGELVLPTGSVSGLEIFDGSVAEADLDATNSATDNYLLSYDQTSGGFTWVDPATAGINYWTEQNGVLSPYNGTDVIAATSSGTTVATFTANGTNNALRAGGSSNYLAVNQNGGLVFTGTATDITTANGENLTLIGAGAGIIDLQDATTVDSLTTDTGGITILAGQAIVPSASGALTIGNSNLTNLTITTDGTGNGELVLPTGSVSGTEITDATVQAVDLNTINSATDNYVLTYDNASGNFEWVDPSSVGSSINYWNLVSGVLSPDSAGDGAVAVAATTSATTVATFMTSTGGSNDVLKAGDSSNYLTINHDGDINSSDALTIASGGGAGLTLNSASNTLTFDNSDTTLSATGLTALNLGAATVDFNGAGTLQYGDGSNFTIADDGTHNILKLTGASNLMEFGNATDNNAFTFLGTGAMTIGGNTTVSNGNLTLGSNGSDGRLTVYSEQGGTDYTTVFTTGTQSQNITYVLPPDDGTANYVLTTDGSGTLQWSSVTGIPGSGDITTVGDVTSGDAFTSTGTQGTQLYFYDAQGRGQLTIADLTGAQTYTLPDATGEISLLGQSISGTEIVDNTIEETDLEVTNSPTDNYILTFDLGTGGFTWVDPATAGTNYWTSDSGVLSPVTAGNVVAATSSGTTVATFTANGTNNALRVGGTSGYSTFSQLGGLTFNNVATDITTASGEDLTLTAAGAGIISLNDSITAGGTLTFSGVATDITTASGESLVLSGAGAGTVDIQDATTVDSLTTDTGGITILAGQSIIPSALGNLTIGNGNLQALTITTDGTGDSEVVLPTGAVSGTEITDDTIKEVDLNATNSPTSAYLLSYDSAGGFTWVDPTSAGTNYWTKVSGILSPLNVGDGVAATSSGTTVATFTANGTNNALRAGGSSNYLTVNQTGGLTFNGTSTDITTASGENLTILAAAAGIVDIQDSTTVDSLTVDNGGITILAGQAIVPSTTGALTIGNSNLTGLTITTDGTGDGELTLPGGSVSGTEITDDSVKEIDLNVTNSPTSGYLLTYDSAGGFTWVDPSTAGTNYWTKVNGVISPLNLGDVFAASSSGTTVGTLTANGTNNALRAGGSSNYLTINQTGGLTFNGTTTDITTASGENLTILAAGAGIVDIQDATTVDSLTTDTGGITILAGQSIVPSGVGTLTIGNSSLQALTITTDGTGDAELVVPNGSISGNEITDDSIKEVDLNATNSPTSAYLLSYDSGGGFTWVDPTSAGTNYWTKVSGILSPLNVGDGVAATSSGTTVATFTANGTNNALRAGGSSNYMTVSQTGGLTFNGTATDITTGAGENLTLIAAGAGIVDIQDATTVDSLTTDTGGITILAGQAIVPSTTGALTIGNSSLTGLTITTDGTGDGELTLPGGSVSGTEITDDSVKEIDLNVTNSPTSGYVLTYDSAGGFTWVDPSATGTNYWTKVSGVISPLNLGDALAATSSGTTVATFTANGTNKAFRAGGGSNYMTVDQTGGLTFNGTATDITTASGENLTILAAGAGIVDIQDSTTVDSLTTDTGGITILAGQAIVPSGAGSLTIGNGSLTALTITTDGTGNGEVVLPTDSISGTEILDSTINEVDLNATNSPTSAYLLSYDSGGGFTWVDPTTAGTNYWTKVSGILSPVNVGDGVAATSSGTTVATFTANGTNKALRAGGASSYLTVDQTGGLTFNGTGTDITTASGENLTILAAGAGIVDIQDATTVDSLTTDTGGITILAGQAIVPSGAGSLTIGNGSLTQLTVTTDGTGNAEVVLPNDSIGSAELLDSSISEVDLNVTNSPTSAYLLSYDSGGGFTWVDPSSAGTNYWTKVSGVLSPALTEPIAASTSATTVATFTANGTNNALRAGSSTSYLTVDSAGDIGSSDALTIASGGSGALNFNSASNTVSLDSSDTTLSATGLTTFTTAASLGMTTTTTLTLGSASTVASNGTTLTLDAATSLALDGDTNILFKDGGTNYATISQSGTQDLLINSDGNNVIIDNTDTLDIYGNSIGLNSDADTDNYIGNAAAAGQASTNLYWGNRLLCDASVANCGWATSAGASLNYFQRDNGTASLAPGNDGVVSDNFVLGGNTTTAFQFEVNGSQIGKALASFNETGDQNIITASASGATVFNLTRGGNIQIGDLTLGYNDATATLTTQDTNEDLLIDPNGTGAINFHSSSSNITSAGKLTLADDLVITGGDITFGLGETISNATDNVISFGGTTNSVVMRIPVNSPTEGSLNASNGNMYYNSSLNKFRCYESGAWVDCIPGTASAGGWTDDGTIVRLSTAQDQVGIGTSSPVGRLGINDNGLSAIGKALLTLNQAENQDIIAASASGTTVMQLTNAGNLVFNQNSTISTTNSNLTLTATTAGDVTIGPATTLGTGDDLFFQDGTMTAAVPLTVSATALDPGLTQGIVDAINEAYAAAVGGGSGLWGTANNAIFPNVATRRVGVGTNNSGDIAQSFYVTNASSATDPTLVLFNQTDSSADIFDLQKSTTTVAKFSNAGNLRLGSSATDTGKLNVWGAFTGKALAIFNETGDQNIITASASGTTVMNLDRSGNLSLKSQGDQRFYDSDNSNYVGFQAPSNITTDVVYTLPDHNVSAPSSDYVLTWQSGNQLQWKLVTGVGGAGDITAVGSMTSGDAFSDATADDDWLGLGASAGRIEFDDQTVDEVNIISAKLGVGTSTPTSLFNVDGTVAGKALAIFNDTGSDQNILTASASGTTVANLDRSGNLAIEGAISDLSGTVLAVNDDLKVTGDDIIDSGNNTRISLGATTTVTATTTSLTGDLTVSGNDIAGSGGTALTFTGTDTQTAGDLTVGGGDILSTVSANLLNATSTTINFAGAATTLNIADAAITGSIHIGGVTNDGISSVDIATNGTRADTINIGNSNASTLVSLTGGDDWSITSGGAATFNGNVILGNANTDTLTINAGTSGTGITFADNTLHSCTALETNASGVLVCGSDAGTGSNYWADTSNTLYPGGDAAVTDKMVLGGNSSTNFQFEVNGRQTGKALVALTETGDQNILTASSSATTTVFNLTRTGNVEADGVFSFGDTTPDGVSYNKIGTGTKSGANVGDGSDLFITDSLEVDGTTYLDGALDSNSDVSIADTNIAFDGASTTFTTTGAFTLTPGGAVLLGDGGDTMQVDTSDWDISTTGNMTGIGNLTMDGRFDTGVHGNNSGLNLPTNTGAPAAVTGTVEGDIVWDATGNALYVYDGGSFTQIGGGAYAGWNLAGDSGTPEAIASGNTGTFTGGTGITTTVSATDTLTVAFASGELNNLTWGTGANATIVWSTSLSGATDPTLTFGNDLISVSGDLTVTGNEVTFGNGEVISNATDGTINFKDDASTNSLAQIFDAGSVGNMYVTGGISTYDTSVTTGYVEATGLCLGNGTNCITSWSSAGVGTNYWSVSPEGVVSPNITSGASVLAATSSATTVATFTRSTGTDLLALRAGGTTNYLTVDTEGDMVTAGDLALNGGDITTSSATFNLANAATTLNLGSTNVTRAINIGTGTNADTIHIGEGGTTANTITIGTDAVANTITIGSAQSTTVSITDDNWNVSAAGTGTFADIVCNSASCISTGEITANTIDWTDISDSMTLDASTSIGFGAGALSLTFTNNGSGNEVHNLSSTGDFVIQDNGNNMATFLDDSNITFFPANTSAAGGKVLIDAATADTTLNSTATGGVFQLTVDDAMADTAGGINQGAYVDYQVTNTADVNNTTHRAMRIDFTNSEANSSDTDQIISLQQIDDASNAIVDAGIAIDNAETTASTMTDAIIITSSGVNDGVTDAIDVSAANLTNAVNIGNNFLLGDGIRMFASSSTVWTIEDTAGNDLMTITDGGTTGDLVSTNTIAAYGTSIGLNSDASANNTLSFGAGAGQPTGDLYWGSRLLCTAASVNCGWATSTSSPFTAAGGIIDKTTATDQLRLLYGDAADIQFQIQNTTNSVIPTVDAMQIDLTGGTAGITTASADALQIAWEAGHMTAGGTISGINLALTPISTSTTSTDIFAGVNFTNITGTNASEYAANFGTGWDANLNFAGAGDINLADNTASALTISEAANNYFKIDTTNNSETVTLDLPVSGTTLTGNLFTSNNNKTINIGTGTGVDTINIGTGATAADVLTLGNSAVATSLTFNTGATTTSPILFNTDAVTTGTAFNISLDGLTTGTGFLVDDSTAAGLSSGRLLKAESVSTDTTAITDALLGYYNWNPGSATTKSGDLFRINIGTNGNVTNVFDVTDTGSTLFSVSENQITSAVPHQFTAPGDVTIAYDLVFGNQTSSNIKAKGPLTIDAGESFESNDMTLTTYNSGQVVVDTTGLGGFAVADVPSSYNLDGLFSVEGAKTGKALAIFNETGNQDMLVASDSGTTMFRLAKSGNAGGLLYIDPSTGAPATCSVGQLYTSATTIYYCSAVNTWTDLAGGGGTPGGSSTQVQYNNGGAFGGMSEFTYNNATGVMTMTDDVVLTMAGTEHLDIANTTMGAQDLVAISPTWTADNTADGLSITTTYNLSTVVGKQYGINVTNADNTTNTGVIDALGLFSNDQATETLANGILIRHNAASGTLTSGLTVDNTTAGGTVNNGIQVSESAGTVTNGISIGTGVGTALVMQQGESIDNTTNNQINMNLGATGTLLLTSSTSSTISNSAGSIILDSTGGTIDINDGTIDLATQATDIEVASANASALTISQSTNNYLLIDNDATTVVTLDTPVAGGTSTTGNLFTSNVAKTINLGTGTAADVINIGTGGTAADTITMGNTGVATTFTFNAGSTTTTPVTFNLDTVTTATGMDLSFDGLTTGTGVLIDDNTAAGLTSGTLLHINSVGTALAGTADTGDGLLANFDWNPGTANTIGTGDLFRIRLDGNGSLSSGSIFNIVDESSSIFNVKENQITSALPHQFTAAGDVAMAYDLVMTNQTIANINSYGPLTISSGESFESNNLTLQTYNSGQIYINGSLNGATVTSNTTSTATGTNTVTGRGVSYYLHDDSGTTNTSYTTNFDITGVPTTEGSIVFIRSGCQKGATAGSQTHTCAIKVNGTQISSVPTATGTGASTVLENYIAVYLNGGWRVITGTGTADSADYAEVYKADTDVDAAEVVSLASNDNLKVRRAVSGDNNLVIGVTSTKPAIQVGEEFDADTRKIAVALSGRVPVKIAANSGNIAIGDLIGVSSEPGKAQKVDSGYIVGRALESWNAGSNKSSILVFVNNMVYQPLGNLSGNGDVKLAADSVNPGYQKLTDANGNTVEKLSGLKSLLTDSFTSLQGTVDHLLVKVGLVSPEVLTDNIKPTEGNDSLTVTIGDSTPGNSAFGKLLVKNSDDKVVAEVDEAGNATFSGEVRANRIVADEIVGLDAKLAQIQTGNMTGMSREDIEKMLNDFQVDQQSIVASQSWTTNTATGSASLNEMALENLYVTGQAAFKSLSLSDNLMIGTDMVISAPTINGQVAMNSIDTLAAPLSIQTSGTQPLLIMAGKVAIDTNGNVDIAGDLAVGGTVDAKSLTLTADANNVTGFGKLLSVVDSLGGEVAGISATGSATFRTVAADKISFTEDKNATSSATLAGTVFESSATAGTAKVPAGATEVTIKNPNILGNSLVFVTPTSSTTNILYIKTQKDGEIHVGFDSASATEVTFNWWIVGLTASQ